MQAHSSKLLKKDLFGQVRLETRESGPVIVRDTVEAPSWTRWLARRLLAREARALAALTGVDGVPQIVAVNRDSLERSWIDGQPMQVGKPADLRYFHHAARLLRHMHRAGVVHNDLAKEPNLLVTVDGTPAMIDFQLAWYAPSRGRLFRLLGREDIRHLLKHKRTYCPAALTARERRILETPSLPSRLWMQTGKRAYLFVTRRILGWADREGAGDRF
ncbi:MAG: serine/threonine protein kinase [Gammaproteobacteria bacterium]|nr:serine/threonine protein kinase [Gammaproteobacteria bacterium]